MLDVLQGEDLAACCQQQLFHVLAPHLEAAAGDAGDNLEFRRIVGPEPLNTKRAEVLNTRPPCLALYRRPR